MPYLKLNDLTEVVIGLPIKVRKKLIPGFLESVYQAGLAYELQKANILFEKEKDLPLGSVRILCGYNDKNCRSMHYSDESNLFLAREVF